MAEKKKEGIGNLTSAKHNIHDLVHILVIYFVVGFVYLNDVVNNFNKMYIDCFFKQMLIHYVHCVTCLVMMMII